MRLTILGDANSWHVQQLTSAASQRQLQVTIRSFPWLNARLDSRRQATSLAEGASAGDVVLVRSMPRGSLEQIIFRMDALAAHQQTGYRVVNSPRSLEIAIDKYLGLVRLQAAGVPVPHTVVCQDLETARQAFHELGGDVVIKPLFGSEGRGLARIKNAIEAEAELAKCQQATGLYYLQTFIPHAGFDYRMFVVGSEVFAMRRENRDDWRLNVRLGAQAGPLKLSDEMHALAVKCCTAVDAEIAAVDVLPDRDGRLYVLEVNACPGWRALQSITRIEIADRICHYLESSSQCRRQLSHS